MIHSGVRDRESLEKKRSLPNVMKIFFFFFANEIAFDNNVRDS